jgi:hypothetical protein
MVCPAVHLHLRPRAASRAAFPSTVSASATATATTPPLSLPPPLQPSLPLPLPLPPAAAEQRTTSTVSPGAHDTRRLPSGPVRELGAGTAAYLSRKCSPGCEAGSLRAPVRSWGIVSEEIELGIGG